jgi:UDP-4-amino-4,6-dideoxy-N-acetyl-beta-L-altrosamine transaminase
MNPIPYGKQNITQADIDAVVESLKSDFLTQGPKIKEFEDNFAKYVGSKFAVAVSNGTAALHLCTLALGVKKGDKVITTPITFAASANCIRYCDGDVVFADINSGTYLIDFESVRKLLEASPKGTYQGIITVDFAGRAVELESFRNLANEFGLWIIQDSCHSPGGYFNDTFGEKQYCGNGKFAELAIFSFHPVKHIACGEGGMITTNDENLYNKLLMLRTHGITKNESLFQNSIEFAIGTKKSSLNFSYYKFPAWYMEMQELGFNYRLTDFQAALGLSQLNRASQGLERRMDIAKQYYSNFQDRDFVFGQSGLIEGHAYHLYIIEVENRFDLFQYLREKNIFSQIHYIPVHLMPSYKQFGWLEGDFPNAENYYKNCISLPMYPTLSDGELDYIIKTILTFYNV